MVKPNRACECSDPGCPCCHGSCGGVATEVLYRVDMADATGTLMCEGCAVDAYESGLFRGEDEGEADEEDGQGFRAMGWTLAETDHD